MPRIVAALAVLAALAFCIAFNTARYPRVWEMLNPASPAAEAARTMSTAPRGQPGVATAIARAPVQPVAAALPPAPPPWTGGGGRSFEAESSRPGVPARFASATIERLLSSGAKRPAIGAGREERLVPVPPRKTPRGVEVRVLGGGVRRLPAVEPELVQEIAPRPLDGPTPIYPTTRVN